MLVRPHFDTRARAARWKGGGGTDNVLEQHRVLVPADDPDTVDILCSVETFRRPILINTKPTLRRSIGYSIASVFTPPQNRKKGYAKLMMTRLHNELASSDALEDLTTLEYDETVDAKWKGGEDGQVSFLYSDVGDFYSRCGPPGWTIMGQTTTTWTVGSLPVVDEPSQPADTTLQLIDESRFADIATRDSKLIQSELSALPTISFAAEPTPGTYHWSALRAQATATAYSVPVPTTWGFELTSPTNADYWSFLAFTYDAAKRSIKILRIRSDVSSFLFLLQSLVKLAKEFNVETITGWNVPQDLLAGLEKEWQGETKDRDSSLPALAWYGAGPSPEWRLNEGYAWC